MDNINETVTKNFKDNIAYIQQHHPKLFEKLSALDTAVENGHYEEKYELVYENDGFDVLEKSSGQYLYNLQIDKHTNLSLQSANNQLDNNVFEGFIRIPLQKEQLGQFHQNKDLSSSLNFTAEILYASQQNLQKTTVIKKYIYFGIGLGLHIEPISEKLNSTTLFLIEDDIELFRLSLFCTNYAHLAKKRKIFFSIFETDEEFSNSAKEFLSYKYYLNHYIKYFQLLSHNSHKNNLFYLELTNQSHLRFLFNDLTFTYTKPLQELKKKIPVIQDSINISSYQKPFLLLCSGPSLQKKITWVQKNQQKFTIVAVSSALSYLEKMSVKVDIITHLDPFDNSLTSFKKIKDLNYFQNSLKIFSITSPSKVLELFYEKNLFLTEVGTSYQENSLKISAPCVGSWSLLLLLALQAKEIYLLGLDLALDPKTGKDHIDEHQDGKSLSLNTQDLQDSTLKYKESSFDIEGNFRDTVRTTPHFFGSIEIINNYFTKIKKEFQSVYNLGDGAKLKLATPKDIQHITMVSSFDEAPLLSSLLEQNSKYGLSPQDIQTIQKKYSHAKTIQQKINSIDLQNDIEAFLENIIECVTSNTQLIHYELNRILDDYLKYISHYLFDILSQQTSKKEQKKSVMLFRDNINKLIDIYADVLNSIPNKKEYNE
jgi:hypothetical protein